MRGNPLMYINTKRNQRVLTHACGNGCPTEATKRKKDKKWTELCEDLDPEAET